MTDEEYVRSKWRKVSYCSRDETNSCCPPSVFIAPFSNGKWVADFCKTARDEAWSAAAAFTRDREEQIRQVEENVRALGNKKSMLLWEVGLKMKFGATDKTEIMLTGLWTRELCAYSRILAREQAALADLKRGMK